MKTIVHASIAAALLAASVTAASAAEIISSETSSDVDVPVVVRNLGMMADGTVSGTVVNTARNPVRDPQVMIQYQWLWTNERHPGIDNPGFAESVSLRGEIPPGGKVPFTYTPSGGLPRRGDGRFEPFARVTSFTEVLPPGAISDESRPLVRQQPVQAVVVPRGVEVESNLESGRPHALVVNNVAMTGDGTVSGVVVNRTNHIVRDPELLVQFAWLWADEFHPGVDNPGWTDTVTVRGEIPPGGTLPFRHSPAGGLPERTDGRFEPQVSVLSFTEVMAPAGSTAWSD